jgi:hypothetical protein
MSHRISISNWQTSGDDSPAMRSYKRFMMNNLHGVSSGNPHQCWLEFKFEKARLNSLFIIFLVDLSGGRIQGFKLMDHRANREARGNILAGTASQGGGQR